MKISTKYHDNVIEISVEGHTDAADCHFVSGTLWSLLAFFTNDKGSEVIKHSFESGDSYLKARTDKKDIVIYTDIAFRQLQYNNPNIEYHYNKV